LAVTFCTGGVFDARKNRPSLSGHVIIKDVAVSCPKK
jgi:hypothetical protein